MAIPKKGLRTIIVQTIKYYWTVKVDHYNSCLIFGIGQVATPNQHVSFQLKYEDPWLSLPVAPKNEVSKVTPKLVREAVLFADSIKWTGKVDSKFWYQAGVFRKLVS